MKNLHRKKNLIVSYVMRKSRGVNMGLMDKFKNLFTEEVEEEVDLSSITIN